MSIDTDLQRYLHARATDLHLPPADVGAVTRAARHRRRRRAAARTGVAAALLAGGALIVVDRPRTADTAEHATEGGQPTALAASPLEWATVASRAGLGWNSHTVAADGAVYSLSTAPDGTGSALEPRRLYRSADGTDWEDVPLPEGLHASSVAAADGSVYAVGTTAAGGVVTGVSIAASADGGEWAAADVPIDLDGLAAGFPGEVNVLDTSVSAVGATTVVAVTVQGAVNPFTVIGDDGAMWFQEQGGMVMPVCDSGGATVETLPPEQAAEREAAEAEGGAAAGSTTMPPSTVPADASQGPLADDPATDDPATDEECTQELRTWADLGLSADQAALADGEVHVFAATDDGALAETMVLPGRTSPSTVGDLLAADDGWWLVTRAPAGDGLEVWHSVDGVTWTATDAVADTEVIASGVVGGRPVLVTYDWQSPPVVQVHRVEPGGSVTSVEVNELLGLPGSGLYAYGVGPLGVALVVPADDGPSPDLVVAHSLDGLAFATAPLPAAEAGTRETVVGVTVTADAVKVRLTARDEGDIMGEGPADQRLFVGTL